MRWIKKERIYTYDGSMPWAAHSFSKPTPILRHNGDVRIFGGLRDSNGVSRIGFIDVDSTNLTRVKQVSSKPLVDIGVAGTFDDNGVVPTVAIRHNGKIFLYYEGYQLAHKVKFLSYTGLAISTDDGESFIKYSACPVMERSEPELLIRAIHSILIEKNVWRVWYTAGSKFVQVNKTFHPHYNIRYCTSNDGIHFPLSGEVCVDVSKDEYRTGKPFVFKKDGMYHMYFSYASHHTPYRIGHARSTDGRIWERTTDSVIDPSEKGWDSEMICYPYVFELYGKTLLFYNGNNFGATGVGYAELA